MDFPDLDREYTKSMGIMKDQPGKLKPLKPLKPYRKKPKKKI